MQLGQLVLQRHRGHPNLLEAYFDDGAPLRPGWVCKPLFSREGANVEMHFANGRFLHEAGPYGGTAIRQQLHVLPSFSGHYPLLGSWVIGDAASGIGIREDSSPLTRDSARFVPHAIIDEAVRPITIEA